ncbi:glycosyltransferase [Citricoccus sp. SGAir0253]|uniref:glycosyltransferase family 4 protein n=1 Tax=Citricoccus sp. SGAir0253 TaxID=2567881 RepID=UPI0010CCFB0D|nr:glycosyltransferase family 4 protein [Citricoccus sp. SGAir0253]QCU78353.1 glycosyltransferase [Citricoccus sp. SGAir0253]
MTVPDRIARLRGVPWARNASLTAQTVAEHVVDDPVQLLLQVSRRVPDAVSRPLGAALGVAGRPGNGVLAAVGHEMRGERERAERALAAGARRRPSARATAHRADALLGWGDPEAAERLLGSVPEDRRGPDWYAVAARLAAYRGDLDAAAALAGVHPRNRALRRRLEGERDAFGDHVPVVPAPAGYAPVPGRVLHVLTNSLPHTASGYAHRSHAILRSLVDRGFEVRAVTRPGYPVQVGIPWGARQDTLDGIDYVRLVPRRMAQGQAARLDQYAALLAEQVERFRPALLHTTTHFTNALVVRAVAAAYGIPWVYEVRGQLADTWAAAHGPGAADSQRYRRFVAREAEVARSADGVVTLGEGMRRRLVEAGVEAARISVCPNAVDERFLAEPTPRDEARARLGLDPADLVVGTVSSLVDYEGLHLLVRAVARLAPAYPRLRLHVVGDGVSRPRLEVLARQLGIGDRCAFPGRVDRSEAPVHHAALDVFVVPRRDLPVTRTVTPMKSVEASAVGRPVVASRLPALEELVQEGRTGLLFEPESEQDLARALRRLLDDPAEAARFGAAGRQWVRETRTWARNAETYARLYDGLGVHVDIVDRGPGA